ncbi:predicted protein, partial [Naegleria gruberi]
MGNVIALGYVCKSIFSPVVQFTMLKMCLSIGFELIKLMKIRTRRLEKEHGLELPFAKVMSLALTETCIETINRARQFPLANYFPMFTSSDSIYFDCVNSNLMAYFTVYLNMKSMEEPEFEGREQLFTVMHRDHVLLDGSWMGWLKDESNEIRFMFIDQCLREKGWTIYQVESLMTWDMITRDDGWLSPSNTLNFKSEKRLYSGVRGFIFDTESGDINLELVPATSLQDAYFSWGDVDYILKNGIRGIFFSLDPPDHPYPFNFHTFQQIRVGPTDVPIHSDIVMTFLHADYLLKMISSGVEVNSYYPFHTRDVSNILEILPERLRAVLSPIHHRDNYVPDLGGSAHRFWIDCEEIPTYTSERGGKISYTLGKFDTKVKTMKMLYNSLTGQLEDDEHAGSSESEFANAFSKHYEEISQYFPVLRRVSELYKLFTICTLLISLKERLNDMSSQKLISLPRPNLDAYPLNSSSEIDKVMRSILTTNGISWSDRHKVSNYSSTEKEVTSNLNRNQSQLAQLINEISEHTPITSQELQEWLVQDNSLTIDNIETRASRAIANNKLRVLKAILETETQPKQNSCLFVPSAYSQDTGRRIFGGVNALPRISQIQQAPPPWSGSSQNVRLGGSAPPATISSGGNSSRLFRSFFSYIGVSSSSSSSGSSGGSSSSSGGNGSSGSSSGGRPQTLRMSDQLPRNNIN